MHSSTFDYLKPTNLQLEDMAEVRRAFATFVDHIEHTVPDGPDLDHVMRLLREAAMWCNVAITRLDDGTPRV
jgi:hypothetical protein